MTADNPMMERLAKARFAPIVLDTMTDEEASAWLAEFADATDPSQVGGAAEYLLHVAESENQAGLSPHVPRAAAEGDWDRQDEVLNSPPPPGRLPLTTQHYLWWEYRKALREEGAPDVLPPGEVLALPGWDRFDREAKDARGGGEWVGL